MSWEENKEFNESKPQYQPDPPEPYSLWKKTWKYVVVGVVCFLFGLSITTCRTESVAERNRNLSAENRELKKAIENTPAETVLVPYTVPVPVATASIQPSKEAAPITDAPAAEPHESTEAPEAQEAAEASADTYDHNQYYDIVEQSLFKDSINYSHLVYKVLAKKDITVSATVLAYGEDGNVIGKDSDEIVLTAGQYNFFQFSFENDISTATAHTTVQPKKDSLFTGARNPNAVEMVQYNQSGSELYITFKQNVDELDQYAKFKILFYKGALIVETDDGYFSSHAKNLNGNGSTDVAAIWAYGIDYDRIEYIYEP